MPRSWPSSGDLTRGRLVRLRHACAYSKLLILAAALLLALLPACKRESQAASARTQVSGGQSSPALPAPLPGFRQLPLCAALTKAHLCQLADFNADNIWDVVTVPRQESAPGTPALTSAQVQISYGDGRGGFLIQQTLDVPLAGITCIATAEFNQDGHPDIALAWHDSYDTLLLLSQPDGSYALAAKPLTMAPGRHPHTHSLAATDANADGRADLLSTCADDNALAVQLAQPGGSFVPAAGSPFPAGEHPYDNISCQDLNGDHKIDVVIANLKGRAVSVLRGDGSGALSQFPGSPLPAGERPGFATLGDLDSDGHADILATHDDDPLLAVYWGKDQGQFSPAAGSPLRLPARLWEIHVLDFDGDGIVELLAAETLAHDGAVLVFPGGHYTDSVPEPQRIEVEGGELHYVQPADLNNDGQLDLLVGFWDTRDAVVLLQEQSHP